MRLPKLLQGLGFAVFRSSAMRNWIKRYGHIFEINIPFFGRSVVVSDPALVRSVCTAGGDQLINVQPNMSNLFGPGSVFGLDGDVHRDRRRLLAPAFHGQSLKSYEKAVEDETLRESANWPEGEEFRILEPMNRITLNVILRAIFGADAELEKLRAIVPPYMKLGQRVAFVPAPPVWTRRHSPWRKLDEFRGTFDRMVGALIERAETDPRLGDRTDILALLVRSRRDNGTRMSRWNPLVSNWSGFGVYRIQFEDTFTCYFTALMKLAVAGLGALMDGADGRGLVFQMSLPPKEFDAMSSPAVREQLHRFRFVGDEIPQLHRVVH